MCTQELPISVPVGQVSAPEGLVFNVQRFCTHDGPGIRTTVFLKGCPLHCPWCHNPEGLRPAPELMVQEGRCIRCGRCAEACPRHYPSEADGRLLCTACGRCVEACPAGARGIAGRTVTVGGLIDDLRKDRVFYEESRGGVTFSGGEPLFQPAFLMEVLKACRAEGFHAALDTSGCAPENILLEAAALADLILYDVKHVDDARHAEATGIPCAGILSNLEALCAAHSRVWMRVPVIPGFNDDESTMKELARLAARLPAVRKVCLLPYHRLGTDKRNGLGRPDTARVFSAVAAADLERLAAIFSTAGAAVSTGD